MKRTKTITEFLDTDYKEYSMSVITERAIPSVIDSFKPVQRKIIDMANEIWKTGNEKSMKVFQLCGQTCAKKLYVHGDQSCNGAIINMCQGYKNNLSVLVPDGQVGSLRVRSAASPRYVGCHLSPNFRLVYKDFELIERRNEEGQEIEPLWFLPILPMIIVNASSGLAVGHASNILNRNPKDVVNACIDYLNGKKIKELKPWLSEFSGTWVRDNENKNKWYSKGIYTINEKKGEVHVTELPPSWEFEKYESYLDSLVEKKVIKDYDNNSSSGVDYLLKFKKDDLQELIAKDKLEAILKIVDSDTENLTTLDENEKLKIFDCVEDIVKYFVDFRLVFYQKRKDFLIDKLTKELRVLAFKAKFIKSIIDKKLVVNNVKKEVIIKWLDENKFEKIDDSYNYLLNMPIYSLTNEKYMELMKNAKDKKDELDLIKKKEPKEMYLTDLNELKKKL
jgi:DNA topoisomerase-2